MKMTDPVGNYGVKGRDDYELPGTRNYSTPFFSVVFFFGTLTPLQLETRFGGQNYLHLVWGGVRGLLRG